MENWSALTHLRFEQDTANEAAKAAKEYRDELAPTATHHEVALKRRLLAHPDRAAVAAITGAHALRLWETDITTFAPEIEEDLQAEAKLYSRYTALMAAAKIEIEGQVVNPPAWRRSCITWTPMCGTAPRPRVPDFCQDRRRLRPER